MFEPLVTVRPFNTFEEAIKITNDSEYGLTSIIYTRDQLTANRAVRAINSGMVWVKYVLLPFPSLPSLPPNQPAKLSNKQRQANTLTATTTDKCSARPSAASSSPVTEGNTASRRFGNGHSRRLCIRLLALVIYQLGEW